MSTDPALTPVDPTDDTTSPYDGRPVEDGLGFHDHEATELDQHIEQGTE